MITRWHYCISGEMVTGWVDWIFNVSCGLQEENNISKPQGKTTNWENGMGYHRKRETDGPKERVLYEKGG